MTEGEKNRQGVICDMCTNERLDEMGNILDFLEQTEERFRYKTAVEDEKLSLTYHELGVMARRIGSAVSRRVEPGNPVPVLMEKSPITLAVMLGIVYAGCFYVPVNPENPPERQKKILEVLEPSIVITDGGRGDAENTKTMSGADSVRNSDVRAEVLTAENLLSEDADPDRLEQIRIHSRETDILYALFTSGSTGVPKAVMVSHGAVIRFIGHFTELFNISEKDVIGNQAPFDFDVSVKDIYSCIMTGASLALIPKEYFSTPPRLLDYLCGKKVTTLIWAVSALTLVSALKGLDYRIPTSVDKVLFSGEAMPPKQLREWPILESEDTVPFFIKNAAAFVDPVCSVHSALDLLQFDPVSHMFDLKILPSRKYHLTVFVVIPQVPGLIDPFHVCSVHRIQREMFFRSVRVSVISIGQRFPGDTDFALSRYDNHPLLIVQQKYISSRKCPPCRNLLLIAERSLHFIISTVTCDLCRAVKVYKGGRNRRGCAGR